MKKINNILLLLVSIVVASSAITKFPIAISSKIYKTPTTIASRKNTIKIRFRSDEINLTPLC